MAIHYPESEPVVRTVKHKLGPTAGTGTVATTKSQAHDTHRTLSAKETRKLSMFSSAPAEPAIVDNFRKPSPRVQAKNPAMFAVYVGSILTIILWVITLRGQAEAPAGFILAVSMRLWFMVLSANFAEVLAEGRSKQRAAPLCGIKTTVQAKVLADASRRDRVEAHAAIAPRRGDIVLIEVGDMIPDDGEVIEGAASVDKSAITDESAPVIRESGGDFSSVTGGTCVLLNRIIIRITANPGESFPGRMIPMVEDTKRQKTPNELALMILLVSLTTILMLAIVTLLPYSIFSVEAMKAGSPITITVLVALLVCPISTTIGGLLPAIGVAGMSRMTQANVIATSDRAVEATGGVDMLLLDKTGMTTHGNRQASRFIPTPGVAAKQLAEAAWLSSLTDETPEGRSIVTLACNLGEAPIGEAAPVRTQPVYVVFSAQARISGIDVGYNEEARQIRKRVTDAIRTHVTLSAGKFPDVVPTVVDDVARQGSTPLVVSDNDCVLGVVELKNIMKVGTRECLAELRQVGTKTTMTTGDNRLTAVFIAAEVGIDDFIAEATPETRLALICGQQAQGRLVVMAGGDTNDAPVLTQADVAVAMDSGIQVIKEVGNMVDLDSSPTKLIQTIEIGKQMLMTCGSLTTSSIANDTAKYFTIIPAAFATTYPQLAALNVMHLATPASAVMSAVILNALIIVFPILLALKGVKYRALGVATLLRRNLLIYGLSSLLLSFLGIKTIGTFLAAMGWV